MQKTDRFQFYFGFVLLNFKELLISYIIVFTLYSFGIDGISKVLLKLLMFGVGMYYNYITSKNIENLLSRIYINSFLGTMAVLVIFNILTISLSFLVLYATLEAALSFLLISLYKQQKDPETYNEEVPYQIKVPIILEEKQINYLQIIKIVFAILLVISYLSLVPTTEIGEESNSWEMRDIRREIQTKLQEKRQKDEQIIKNNLEEEEIQEQEEDSSSFNEFKEKEKRNQDNQDDAENKMDEEREKNVFNEKRQSLKIKLIDLLDSFTTFLIENFSKINVYSTYVWIFHVGQVFWGFYRVGEKNYQSDILPFLTFVNIVLFFYLYFNDFWISSILVQFVWVFVAIFHLKSYKTVSINNYTPKF
eukprot:TRINITY_DN5465_c0_g1_i1.p1 TRINITY_DN5465_c0_g1~~TRINITY_DN5465_c0_g1_i1.p1  ORF type:complete len:370 (-),score=79.86 TRINITY_DN5465_c0_g1_i1:13-1101(-)